MLYRWDACGEQFIYSNLCAIGHKVSVSRLPIRDYNKDMDFCWKFIVQLEEEKCEAVFSMNYFPVISEVCMTKGIKYISWVFDCPHLALYSKTIFNPCNFIFLFDREQYRLYAESYKAQTVHYLTLGTDADYHDRLLQGNEEADEKRFRADVSFVGHLYTGGALSGEQKELDALPAYYKGYLDGMIDAQLKLFGYHFIPEMLHDEVEEEIKKYFPRDMGQDYFTPYNSILSMLIDRKAVSLERNRILAAVGKGFPVDVYTDSDTSQLPNIRNRGYAEYYTQMPRVFRYSRINLNITMRSITSGMNLRTLDILGCGGFLLTNYQAETAEYFEDGKELAMYRSEQELLSKIAYYLSHEQERQEIARNGYLKVKERFSYRRKLQKIFDIVTLKTC